MKLIEVSKEHYVIVDDSKSNSDELVFCLDVHYNNPNHPPEKYINPIRKRGSGDNCNACKKITHSTEPIDGDGTGACFIDIKQLSLSEVQELIYGYNLDKMAENKSIQKCKKLRTFDIPSYKFGAQFGFIDGFKAAMEITKDKLFTIDDMRDLYNHMHDTAINFLDDELEQQKSFDGYIQSITKTEWDVEFDEQGKLKLM